MGNQAAYGGGNPLLDKLNTQPQVGGNIPAPPPMYPNPIGIEAPNPGIVSELTRTMNPPANPTLTKTMTPPVPPTPVISPPNPGITTELVKYPISPPPPVTTTPPVTTLPTQPVRTTGEDEASGGYVEPPRDPNFRRGQPEIGFQGKETPEEKERRLAGKPAPIAGATRKPIRPRGVGGINRPIFNAGPSRGSLPF